MPHILTCNYLEIKLFLAHRNSPSSRSHFTTFWVATKLFEIL